MENILYYKIIMRLLVCGGLWQLLLQTFRALNEQTDFLAISLFQCWSLGMIDKCSATELHLHSLWTSVLKHPFLTVQWKGGTHATAHAWRSEHSPVELVVSFHISVESGDQTHVIGLWRQVLLSAKPSFHFYICPFKIAFLSGISTAFQISVFKIWFSTLLVLFSIPYLTLTTKAGDRMVIRWCHGTRFWNISNTEVKAMSLIRMWRRGWLTG